VAGNTANHELTPDQVRVLAEELVNVRNGVLCQVRPRAEYIRSKAIDFLIQEVWDFSPRDTREEWMRSVLGSSKAGRRYEEMLAHYKAYLRRRAEYVAQNSAEIVAQRKAEKARLREQRLQERAVRKDEIDRLWRLKQGQFQG
jgi:hypothetical protein